MTASRATPPWPTELRLNPAKDLLTISFDGGERVELAAEYLRVESPSAEVRGHGASQKQIVPGKRRVSIERIEPVGNYAVRIVFDDGHDSGLYTWVYLLELGHSQDEKWHAYLEGLAAKGLSRD